MLYFNKSFDFQILKPPNLTNSNKLAFRKYKINQKLFVLLFYRPPFSIRETNANVIIRDL